MKILRMEPTMVEPDADDFAEPIAVAMPQSNVSSLVEKWWADSVTNFQSHDWQKKVDAKDELVRRLEVAFK